MSTAQDIIDRIRRLINDEVGSFASAEAWSNAELLEWITDAQREVVKLKPEANAVTNSFEVEVGRPRQRLNIANAYKLIRVEANVGTWESTISITSDLGPQSQTYGYIRDEDIGNEIAGLFVDDFGTLTGVFGGAISGTSTSNGRTVVAMVVRDNNLVLLGLAGASTSSFTVPSTVTISTGGGTQVLELADVTSTGVGADGNYYLYWSNLSPAIGAAFTGAQTVELAGVG